MEELVELAGGPLCVLEVVRVGDDLRGRLV
jgi:hypothetical protein